MCLQIQKKNCVQKTFTGKKHALLEQPKLITFNFSLKKKKKSCNKQKQPK